MACYKKEDLHIRNLSPATTKTELLGYFAGKGFPLCHVWIVSRVQTGTVLERPFANASLEVPADQAACIEALNGSELRGRKLYVRPYREFPAMHEEIEANKARARGTRPRSASKYRSSACETWARHQSGTTNEAAQ